MSRDAVIFAAKTLPTDWVYREQRPRDQRNKTILLYAYIYLSYSFAIQI